jgi:protein required for attachment to host cells
MSDTEAREQHRLELLSSVQGTDTQTIEQNAFAQGITHVLNTTYMSTEASAETFVKLFSPRRLSALNVSSSL